MCYDYENDKHTIWSLISIVETLIACERSSKIMRREQYVLYETYVESRWSWENFK